MRLVLLVAAAAALALSAAALSLTVDRVDAAGSAATFGSRPTFALAVGGRENARAPLVVTVLRDAAPYCPAVQGVRVNLTMAGDGDDGLLSW